MTSKLVYMGSPEFAVPPLQALVNSPQFEIAAVITQPDKPEGRGQKLTPTPVKKVALESNIPVLEPKSLKKISFDGKTLSGTATADALSALGEIDAFIVVAYGKIIPKAIIDFPKFGAINIHPSLLPRWRGAAPLQHALFAGDETTGTCIMQLDEGLDTGPVFSCRECKIEPSDTLGTLHDKLSYLSTDLLLETLPKIISGDLIARPQNEAGVTYAEKWDIEDQTIKWAESAEVIERRVRTCAPNRGARASLGDENVKIHQANVVSDQNYPNKAAGQIVELNKEELVIRCGTDSASYLSVELMQFPGKKAHTISEILKSGKINIDSEFS